MRFFRRPAVPNLRLVPSEPTEEQELLASMSLYFNWRYVTKQLTTEQKNMLADACDAVWTYWEFRDGLEYSRADRWWED